MSRAQGTDKRVLGLRASGGPLFQSALPLRGGLTVLFGLNGSGKSALLDALYAGLTGQRRGLDGRPLPDGGAAAVDFTPSSPADFWDRRLT